MLQADKKPPTVWNLNPNLHHSDNLSLIAYLMKEFLSIWTKNTKLDFTQKNFMKRKQN